MGSFRSVGVSLVGIVGWRETDGARKTAPPARIQILLLYSLISGT